MVYKVLTHDEWAALERDGAIAGAPVDRADGFVHLSTAGQLPVTLAKHFAGQTGLMLLALEAAALGDALAWEPSRGGDLFPHLYAALRRADIRWARPLEPDGRGGHRLPEDLA